MGRSGLRRGLPPSATKRTPSPRPRRPVTLRGGPAGTRGAPRELRTPAPDVRSRDCLIPAPSAEGQARGGAIIRPRPPLAIGPPSPPKQEPLAGDALQERFAVIPLWARFERCLTGLEEGTAYSRALSLILRLSPPGARSIQPSHLSGHALLVHSTEWHLLWVSTVSQNHVTNTPHLGAKRMLLRPSTRGSGILDGGHRISSCQVIWTSH
ncbi:hypothetical protein NN561_014247 [Cricetulus griseus]